MLQLYPDGSSKNIILGRDLNKGQSVQVLVPKDVWQGSYLLEGGKFAFMGTTMSPGFDFSDNEIGKRDDLIKFYPANTNLIQQLTQ